MKPFTAKALWNVPAKPDGQRGAALLIVMVLVLLSLLSVLGAVRMGWMGESILGSEADYQRARAAAEALMHDAMIDVAGFFPDGGLCIADQLEGGCRSKAVPNAVWFPRNSQELGVVGTNIAATGGASVTVALPCWQGVCIPATSTAMGPPPASGGHWWDDPGVLAQMSDPNRSAAYGEFTGALANPSDPILSNPARARYWVEVFQYAPAIATPAGLAPVETSLLPMTGRTLQAGDAMKNLIYRITVITEGVRAGTRVVLQSVVVSVIQRDI